MKRRFCDQCIIYYHIHDIWPCKWTVTSIITSKKLLLTGSMNATAIVSTCNSLYPSVDRFWHPFERTERSHDLGCCVVVTRQLVKLALKLKRHLEIECRLSIEPLHRGRLARVGKPSTSLRWIKSLSQPMFTTSSSPCTDVTYDMYMCVCDYSNYSTHITLTEEQGRLLEDPIFLNLD